MTSRRFLAAAALVVLALTAGCTSLFGPGSPNEERLAANATYGDLWDAPADTTIDLGKDQYRAVVRVENRTTLELSRFYRLNEERPLRVQGIKFRYQNGTVVGHRAMRFERTRSATVVHLPTSAGRLGFTAPKNGKRIRVKTVVEGSYELILPRNGRVGIWLLGRVLPRGAERSLEDGRVHLRWDEVTTDRLVVRYYLVRDLQLLSALLALAGAALIGGLAYFWRQLRTLRERTAAVALDDEGR